MAIDDAGRNEFSVASITFTPDGAERFLADPRDLAVLHKNVSILERALCRSQDGGVPYQTLPPLL